MTGRLDSISELRKTR